MDFLHLGALAPIQGARGIGLHSLFGHAGPFLFSFFPRKEYSLLASLLAGPVPEQETHQVPDAWGWTRWRHWPTAEQVLPGASSQGSVSSLSSPIRWWEWRCSHGAGCVGKPPPLTSLSKVSSPHWVSWKSFSIASVQTSFLTVFITSFAAKSLPNFHVTEIFLHNGLKWTVYFPLTNFFFFLERKQYSWQTIMGGLFCPSPYTHTTHTYTQAHIHTNIHTHTQIYT